jgi:hypothetical protein
MLALVLYMCQNGNIFGLFVIKLIDTAFLYEKCLQIARIYVHLLAQSIETKAFCQ